MSSLKDRTSSSTTRVHRAIALGSSALVVVLACKQGPKRERVDDRPSAEASASASLSASPSASAPPRSKIEEINAPPPEADRKAIAIDVGGATSCAVLANGSVWCWGSDAGGELGWDMPTTTNSPSRALPTHVIGVEKATSVAVSRTNVCAIVAEGAVKCWGVKDYNDWAAQPRILPTEVAGIRKAKQVAVSWGGEPSCAVLEDETVWCWQGVAGSKTPATRVGGVAAVEIALDYGVACLRSKDGTIRCGKTDLTGVSSGAAFLDLRPPTDAKPSKSIHLKNLQLCAAELTGDFACWKGDWSAKSFDVSPFSRAGRTDITAVRGDCVLDSAKHLGCTGAGRKAPPIELDDVTAFAVQDHGCAILSNGSIQCWGPNASGQLGNGKRERGGPTPIAW